jgi:hypothetical protein
VIVVAAAPVLVNVFELITQCFNTSLNLFEANRFTVILDHNALCCIGYVYGEDAGETL